METKEKFTYYSVVNGQITRSFKKEPEGIPTESRVNKNGIVVYEQKFKDGIENVYITNANLKTDDFGDWLEIRFNSEQYGASILTVGVQSNHYRSFMSRLPNIDITKPVSIYTYEMEVENGKVIKGFYFKQSGEKIPAYFTKENPNGLPQPKQLVVNKKTVYDWTDQLNFYEDLLRKTFVGFTKKDYSATGTNANKVAGTEFKDEKGQEFLDAQAEFQQEKSVNKAKKTVVVNSINEDDDDSPF